MNLYGDFLDAEFPGNLFVGIAFAQLGEMKTIFISNINHEFRQPLSIIYQTTELIEMMQGSDDNAELKKRFGRIHNSVDRLQKMIDAVIELASLESGHQPLQEESLDSMQIIEESCGALSEKASLKNMVFAVDKEIDAPLFFQIDHKMIRLGLDHLLDNAVRFGAPDSAIGIHVGMSGSQVRLRISNKGPLVSNDLMEKIFEPFFQGVTTEAGSTGAGVGLAICQKIIFRHHGRIWAQNDGNEGVSVFLTLPASARRSDAYFDPSFPASRNDEGTSPAARE